MTTYSNVCLSKLTHNPSWFRMKLRMFHAIMHPVFLIKLLLDIIMPPIHTILLAAMHPFITPLQIPLYWLSIAMACIGLLRVEFSNTFIYPTPPRTIPRRRHRNLSPHCMFSYAHCHPLPRRHMVLNGVMLNQEFVGWLAKTGRRFSGFMHSMHKIGDNFTYLTSLSTNTASKSVKRYACRTSSQFRTNFLFTILFTITTTHAIIHSIPHQGKLLCKSLLRNPIVFHNPQYSIVPECIVSDVANNILADGLIDPIKIFHDPILCFTTMTDREVIGLVLNNTDNEDAIEEAFSFKNEPTEFGTDNCATHHICSELGLFIDMRPAPKIGVMGVSGSSMASGVGTIRFIITDDDGNKHTITLHDVIYLPASSKNLISTSKWAADKQDDCGVLSRERYSIFMWDNDSKCKHIEHPPNCRIPLMQVNEADDAFILFNTTHASTFPDNQLLMPNGVYPQVDDDAALLPISPQDTNTDQQSAAVPLCQDIEHIPIGSTIWHSKNTRRRVAIVTKYSPSDHSYDIRPLNSTTCQSVPANEIQNIHPEPADLPVDASDVDAQILTDCLSPAELSKIWTEDSTATTSDAAKLALYWHHRLRHAPLTCLHRLASRGVLPKSIATVKTLPLCAACAFATAHRRSWRTKAKLNNPIRQPNHDAPGRGTSCDHVISHQPGLIPQSSGILTYEKFWGSVLYSDHYSDFVYNHLITGTTSIATLESKQAYERVAASYGVSIKAYHADNLRFNDNNFKGDCIKGGQTLTHCGVGAHHQNAIAESKIKLMCYGARTVLLHAKRKWPTVIATALWPYAMQSIVERHNRLSLDINGRSPLEKFSNTIDNIDPTDFHTWGCPVYILDAANQGAIGTPKWEPRSHTGIYLGHSPCHAGSVALVLHLQTGHVSPQFHVVFDDEFSTVPYLRNDEPPPNWIQLLHHSSEKATEDQAKLSHDWLHPSTSSTPPPLQTREPEHPIEDDVIPAPEGVATPPTTIIPIPEGVDATASSPTSNMHKRGEVESDSNSFVDIESIGLRRSSRTCIEPTRMSQRDPKSKELRPSRAFGLLILAASTCITPVSAAIHASSQRISHCYQTRAIQYEDYLDRNFDGTANSTHPLAQVYITSKSNNETYTIKEMLKEPDKDEFLKAMNDEVASLFKKRIWKMVPRSEMKHHYNEMRMKGKDISREQIMMIWSFKRKRHPDGTFNKCKARLCCHGGQQQWGVNYWDTYAPVVSWSSVRILLTIAKLHNLHTKSVDFVQAYPQAAIQSTIYLRPPAGVVLNDKNGEMVLKLLKNLYGLKDAGRTWFEHLSDGLSSMNFVPTASDPVYSPKGMISSSYTLTIVSLYRRQKRRRM